MPGEPNANNVKVGAGTLWIAPLGTVEPVAGVLTPVTPPATTVAWPSAWTQLGYTTDGSEVDWTPKLAPIDVAEVLLPLRYVTTSAEQKIMFALAEITALHVQYAFNGGTVSTTTGITTFTPPNVGQEVRMMLGWDSIDGLERIIWRRVIQAGTVKQVHKKAPNLNSLPIEFMVEFQQGVAPFSHYFDSSLAA